MSAFAWIIQSYSFYSDRSVQVTKNVLFPTCIVCKHTLLNVGKFALFILSLSCSSFLIILENLFLCLWFFFCLIDDLTDSNSKQTRDHKAAVYLASCINFNLYRSYAADILGTFPFVRGLEYLNYLYKGLFVYRHQYSGQRVTAARRLLAFVNALALHAFHLIF